MYRELNKKEAGEKFDLKSNFLNAMNRLILPKQIEIPVSPE